MGGGGGGGGEMMGGALIFPHIHIYIYYLVVKIQGGSKSGEISRGPPPLYKILLVIIIPTTYKLGINYCCVSVCVADVQVRVVWPLFPLQMT